MLIQIAQLKAVQNKGDELEREFSKIIPKVREESGTLTYIVHRALDDPQKFLVYEKYRDEEALKYHVSTSYIKEFINVVSSILDGRPEMDFYREIE
jgi:quinol monooxygenase YgiN